MNMSKKNCASTLQCLKMFKVNKNCACAKSVHAHVHTSIIITHQLPSVQKKGLKIAEKRPQTVRMCKNCACAKSAPAHVHTSTFQCSKIAEQRDTNCVHKLRMHKMCMCICPQPIFQCNELPRKKVHVHAHKVDLSLIVTIK